MRMTQLQFDMTPRYTVAVGDRVRVAASYPALPFRDTRPGMTGVVVNVRPPPSLDSRLSYHPVAVEIDQLGGDVRAFEHQYLEVW